MYHSTQIAAARVVLTDSTGFQTPHTSLQVPRERGKERGGDGGMRERGRVAGRERGKEGEREIGREFPNATHLPLGATSRASTSPRRLSHNQPLVSTSVSRPDPSFDLCLTTELLPRRLSHNQPLPPRLERGSYTGLRGWCSQTARGSRRPTPSPRSHLPCLDDCLAPRLYMACAPRLRARKML